MVDHERFLCPIRCHLGRLRWWGTGVRYGCSGFADERRSSTQNTGDHDNGSPVRACALGNHHEPADYRNGGLANADSHDRVLS